MSNTMNDLHAVGLNPFAVQLLAESMLKSAYVKHCGTQPLTFNFPVQREDCAGWIGVRITIEGVPADQQPQDDHLPEAGKMIQAKAVPQGYVLVPEEITDEMIAAFAKTVSDDLDWDAAPAEEQQEARDNLREPYRAMLKAAPQQNGPAT